MPKTFLKASKTLATPKSKRSTKLAVKKGVTPALKTVEAVTPEARVKTAMTRSYSTKSAEIRIERGEIETGVTGNLGGPTSVPAPKNGMSARTSTGPAARQIRVSRGFSLSNSKFSLRKNGSTETVKESRVQVEFKVGDNAVYPGHGVGTVMAIEAKEISGKRLEFYVVQMKDTGMRVLVPKGNTSSVGLRPIISKSEAEKVMSILKDHPVKMDHQTWNRRYREYMEKIRTGSIYEIAEVLRALVVLRADKELSYGERNMLENARRLLMVELSLAVEKSELEARPEMREMLGL